MSHQVTARVSDDLYEDIEAVSSEIDGSRADAIRDLLEKGIEFDEIKEENERLKNQLAAVNRRIDEVNDLVEYVEETRSLEERRLERQDAPVWRRAKWWVFGRG